MRKKGRDVFRRASVSAILLFRPSEFTSSAIDPLPNFKRFHFHGERNLQFSLKA